MGVVEYTFVELKILGNMVFFENLDVVYLLGEQIMIIMEDSTWNLGRIKWFKS